MEPILLNDSFILELASRKNVQAEFSFIKDAAAKLKQKTSCCNGANTNQREVTQALKTFILTLPPTQIAKLKALLNLKAEQQIVTYARLSGNRLTKISL